MERIQDAEGGAIALLDENNEMLSQARLTMANITGLQNELARAQRGSIINFSIGGASLGVGVPLVIEGMRTYNQAMLWSGAGTTVIGSAIWAIGHFVFQWW